MAPILLAVTSLGLGLPEVSKYIHVLTKSYLYSGHVFQVVIPVRGSKAKGNVYSFATRTEDDG